MSKVEFKVGDLVYCPTINNKISKITKTNEEGDIFLSKAGWFRPTGLNQNNMPIIFPATQEWHDKLVHVYPELEAPPKPKEPVDVIIAMLEGGYKTVCLSAPLFGYEIVGNPTHARNACHAIKIFRPYNLKKGKYIIDFIDGKCVLENGEVILESENAKQRNNQANCIRQRI